MHVRRRKATQGGLEVDGYSYGKAELFHHFEKNEGV